MSRCEHSCATGFDCLNNRHLLLYLEAFNEGASADPLVAFLCNRQDAFACPSFTAHLAKKNATLFRMAFRGKTLTMTYSCMA